jgi:hypothetical protein
VEAVGNLHCLRSTTSGGTGILAATIPTDMSNFMMALQPRHDCFCLAIGQEVDNAMSVQIHQDRAEGSAAQK